MSRQEFRYEFEAKVPIDEVKASLLLAIWSCEALHGAAQVRLDVGHHIDTAARSCVISSDTPVGLDTNRLFVAFVSREFGPDSFTVHHIRQDSPTH